MTAARILGHLLRTSRTSLEVPDWASSWTSYLLFRSYRSALRNHVVLTSWPCLVLAAFWLESPTLFSLNPTSTERFEAVSSD